MKRGEHHEFECKLYDRISPRVCRVCEKGYHYDMECANRRDSRTNLLAIGIEKKNSIVGLYLIVTEQIQPGDRKLQI